MQSTIETMIKEKISDTQDQYISFRDFMEIALYHETEGYYSKPKQKIGKEGDFFTSSSVNEVFGYVIADQIAEMISYMEDKAVVLVEYGGGNGSLSKHILDRLSSSYPHIYSYISLFMIEKSEYHKRLQKENLSAHEQKVLWVEQLTDIHLNSPQHQAIIYSNELIDAFPVNRIRYYKRKWEEQVVVIDQETNRLRLDFYPLKNAALEEFITLNQIKLNEGQIAEVNLSSVHWVEEVSRWLDKGFIMTIDYGYERDELYAPYRKDGTLMCYFKHQSNTQPLEHIGEQDMTSHVDFTTLIEYGEKMGLQNIGYVRQYQFLLQGGIFSYLKDAYGEDPFSSPIAKRNRAVRQLIQPGGMGDAFSVLIQSKGLEGVYLRCMDSKTQYPF